ncbi:HIT family protein [Flexistipes sp.]|uniref:HIT family protein n=1 Tax=Flexistipes sp. TaxID=3088135 RepID=UPI002E233ECD|nr:HIT family protein [Flexistipes sp.]
MDCLFCKMKEGEIPCQRVYEDDDFFAILDINPINYGHTLLIPKKHFNNILDAPEDVGEKTYPVAQKIAKGIKQALKCDGINIIQNVEEAGGQEVFHSHLHIVPRFKDDNIRFSMKKKKYASDDDMCKFAKKIADVLNR